MQQIQYELNEQIALFDWIELYTYKYPELKLMYHICNEGKRSKAMASLLKKAGLKKGVPDLCLPVARGKYHGLYIELKFGDGKASVEQKWWIEQLKAQGYYAEVVTGWFKASEIIKKYMECNNELTQ